MFYISYFFWGFAVVFYDCLQIDYDHWTIKLNLMPIFTKLKFNKWTSYCVVPSDSRYLFTNDHKKPLSSLKRNEKCEILKFWYRYPFWYVLGGLFQVLRTQIKWFIRKEIPRVWLAMQFKNLGRTVLNTYFLHKKYKNKNFCMVYYVLWEPISGHNFQCRSALTPNFTSWIK